MKLPKTVKELGYRHRRKAGYKYLDLPQLYDNLVKTRKIWLAFNKFKSIYTVIQHNSELAKEFSTELEHEFYCAWITYYGEDAKKELETMHNKNIFEAEDWRVALVMINYDAPKTETYRNVALLIDDTTIYFDTGDPVVDYNAALDHARKEMVDEIIRADVSEMFVLHAKGRLWFNLNEQLVRVERE